MSPLEKNPNAGILQPLLLKPVFENILTAMFFADVEGNIFETNEAACKMFGYSRSELLTIGRAGITVMDAAAEKLLLERKQSEKAVGVVNFKRKNGEIFRGEISSNIIKDTSENVFACISIIDLTEEEKLQQLINEVSEIAIIGGYGMDLKTRKIFWTSITRQIHEVPLDYEPGLENAVQFYKEGEYRNKLLYLIEQLKKNKIGWDDEFIIVTATGNEKWVRVICEPVFVNNEMVSVKGSIQDIHRKKILEAEVLEKNKMVNRLVDLSTDIIAVLDSNGKGKLISDSAAVVLGYNTEEMRGHYLFDLVYEADKETTANIFQLIKKVKVICNYENRIVKKDGSLVYMSWSYIWDEDSECTYCIGRDITENKRMEEELKLSENKFRSIIKRLNVGVIKYRPTAEIMLCNDAALQMFGVTKDQLFGNVPHDPLWKIIHEDGSVFSPETQPVSVAISTQQAVQNVVMGVYRPVTHDSVWLLANATPQFYSDGRMECITVTFADITEKKKMEAEISSQLRRYRMLMQTSQDHIQILNRDGKLLEWNDSFEKHLGYTKDELAQMHAWDWSPVFTKEAVLKILSEVKDEGISFEAQHLLKDGSLRSMDVKLHKFLSNGEAYFYASGRDITELKQKQKQIEDLNAELRELSVHMQHLIEKEREDLAKTIHDEFGQKFVAINMNAELLKRKLHGEKEEVTILLDEQINMAHEVIKASRKLFNLLYPSMLDDLGLIATIQSCCDEHLKSTGISQVLKTDLTEELISKECKLALFRIFQETMTNVMRYSKATKVATDINMEGEKIRMKIVDNGIGFDLHNINTKDHHGLLVMRERAYAMNGKFEVISAIGKGTAIEVELPVR